MFTHLKKCLNEHQSGRNTILINFFPFKTFLAADSVDWKYIMALITVLALGH